MKIFHSTQILENVSAIEFNQCKQNKQTNLLGKRLDKIDKI